MIRSSVLLPAPFRPSTPILAPGRNESQMSLRTTWSGGMDLAQPLHDVDVLRHQSPSSRLPRPPRTRAFFLAAGAVTPGMALAMRSARRLNGSDCSHTLPGPVSVAKNRPFAAEERGLHPADELDVVVDRRLHRDQAAGVDAQRLARLELQLVQHAAGVDEREAVALQPLHDEALAAEQAGADLLLEGDADRDALGGAEERVLLADQLAAERLEVHRQDAARDRARRRRRAAMPPPVLVNTVMNSALTGQQALAGAEQRAHEAGLLRAAAVAEDGLHLDAGRHVHHRRRPRRRRSRAGRARPRRTAGPRRTIW